MVKASKILVSMKDSEILELQAATLTLLGINRIQTPVSEKILKDEFQQIPLKQVVDNANFLVKYGLIPEIELVDEQMEGGEKRARTPSRVMLEAAQSAPDTKSEKQQDAIRASNKKAKRDELLNNIDVTKQFDNKTYDDLEPYIQELGKRICNPKMTGEFVNALFPPVAVNEWKNELNKEFRAIYEPSSPDTQCNNTIGKSELVKECYICGFDMDNTIPDFAASCDHILPIIQAIFF
jgi:predicted transcriptional regulator